MNNVMHSYKQAQVNTIGRADLTVMLYDGAIRFLEQAQEKMLAKDMQAKGNLISRAIDIINELDASLNLEKGGEIAKNLHQLYFLSMKNLLMANIKLDMSILKSVQKNLTSLRDAFAEAMQTPEAKRALAQMGPLPQMAAGNTAKLQTGGSINARAEQVKQVETRVKALEAAKAKVSNAKTPEEALQAKEEMSALMEGATSIFAQKAAPTSLVHKASLAFAKANGQNPQASPIAQVAPLNGGMHTSLQGAVRQEQIIAPVNMARKTALYGNTQAGIVRSPAVNTPVSPLAAVNAQVSSLANASQGNSLNSSVPAQPLVSPRVMPQTVPLSLSQPSALSAQSRVAMPQANPTAQTGSQVHASQNPQMQAPVLKVQQPLNNTAVNTLMTNGTSLQVPKDVNVLTREDVAQTSPQNIQVTNVPLSQGQNTGSLMSRKMGLYKNINNG